MNPDLLFPVYRPQLGLLRVEEMNLGEQGGTQGVGATPTVRNRRGPLGPKVQS